MRLTRQAAGALPIRPGRRRSAAGRRRCLCHHECVVTGALVLAAVGAWAVVAGYTSVTDLRRAIIPRRAVWSAGVVVAALLGAAAGLLGDPLRFAWACVGAAGVGLLLEVIYRLAPGGIGFGDVRLIILNGLLAGWWGVQWSWLALCAGAVAEWPVALVAFVRHGRTARVRWAPGLVVGTAAVLVFLLVTAGPTG